MNIDEAVLAVPVIAVNESAEPPAQKVLCSRATICGRREVNEDVVMAAELHVQQNRAVFAGTVADGLGAHGNGDKAAAEVTKGFFTGLLSSLLFDDEWTGDWCLPEWIARAVQFCNAWLMSYANRFGEGTEMGTTLVAAVIDGATLYLCNVGDSRGYRWRMECLDQLTRDNSWVQLLVDEGTLTPEQAEEHPWSNRITRALGWPDALDELAVVPHPVAPGDIVLLCSDGLWKGSNGLIQEHLGRLAQQPFTQADLDIAVQNLVTAAFENGSTDNISAVALWVAPDAPTVENLELAEMSAVVDLSLPESASAELRTTAT